MGPNPRAFEKFREDPSIFLDCEVNDETKEVSSMKMIDLVRIETFCGRMLVKYTSFSY